MSAKPTQVTRIITRLNVGGPARQAIGLTRELRMHGFDTQLITGALGHREGSMEPGPDVSPTVVDQLQRSMRPARDRIAYRQIRRLVEHHRPVLVHTHMAKAGALGRMAAARAGVPVVVHTFHGHVLTEYFSPVVSRGFLEAEKRLARRTDALVAVSASVRDDLLRLGVGRPDQWHVVPLGLDLDALLGGLPDSTASRAGLGLPPDAHLVGIVGRLAPVKDHATFFQACARMADERPDVHFVVAGDGELRGELEGRAAVLLGGRVHFLGWVTDLPTLYSALDVVALTSRNEGTPVALIEAAAAQKPVVATHVGGVADVVLDGQTGYLTDPADEAAIAQRTMELLGDARRRRAMGEAGRNHVRERYSSRRLVQDTVELYGTLLERKGVR